MCPHLRLRQLVARGGRRAWSLLAKRGTAGMEFGDSYVALAADHLVAVELGGESLQRRLNDTTTETEDEVESRLLQVEIHISRMFPSNARNDGRSTKRSR